MQHNRIQLSRKQADGYVIPMGPVNLVLVVTDAGVVGCGALNAEALDKFSLPTACISGVKTVDDLLKGQVKVANQAALARGIKPGMTGREALELL